MDTPDCINNLAIPPWSIALLIALVLFLVIYFRYRNARHQVQNIRIDVVKRNPKQFDLNDMILALIGLAVAILGFLSSNNISYSFTVNQTCIVSQVQDTDSTLVPTAPPSVVTVVQTEPPVVITSIQTEPPIIITATPQTVTTSETPTQTTIPVIPTTGGEPTSTSLASPTTIQTQRALTPTVTNTPPSLNPTMRQILPHVEAVRHLAFDPTGNQLASAAEDRIIRIWDIDSGQVVKTLRGHESHVLSIEYDPLNPSMLASSGWDGQIRIWNLDTELSLAQSNTNVPTWEVAISSQRQLASVNHDGTVNLLQPNLQIIASLATDFIRAHAIEYNPDGTLIAVGGCTSFLEVEKLSCIAGGIEIWDSSSQQRIFQDFNFGNGVRETAFSSDGHFVAAGNADNTIGIWSTNTWERVATLRTHQASVYAIAFSPDNTLLASVDLSGQFIIHEAQTWQALTQIAVSQVHEDAVAFSPDSQTVATGGYDNQVIIWDLNR